jgi:hypothetical protein
MMELMGGERLDEIAGRLYELPPEDFVAARTEEAERARKAGDRELAAAITKLRKPTVGAWVVNLLAHRRPDLVRELLALATALRHAQRELRGDDLRELSLRRRETVSALARDAVGLAVASGRRRDALPAAEIEATLTAALSDPEVGEAVRTGQLTKTTSYAGFGEIPRPQLRLVQGGEPATKPRAEKRAGRKEPADTLDESEDDRQSAAERRTAERRTAERRAATEQAAAERAAAREAAAARRKREAAAHRELLAARSVLAEAEAARAAADRAVMSAKRRVEAAAAAVEAVRSAG